MLESYGLSYLVRRIVDTQGRLYTWGLNEYNKLGLGPGACEAEYASPREVEAFRGITIVDTACGEKHTCAVDSDGKLYSWGYGGQNWLRGAWVAPCLRGAARSATEAPRMNRPLDSWVRSQIR